MRKPAQDDTAAESAVTIRHTSSLRNTPSLPFDAFIRERYRALADPNMKFSKMDDLCKLAYVASCELLSGHRPDCPAERIGVVMANRSASLDSDRRHQAIIDAGDGCGGFTGGVRLHAAQHHAGAGGDQARAEGREHFLRSRTKAVTLSGNTPLR